MFRIQSAVIVLSCVCNLMLWMESQASGDELVSEHRRMKLDHACRNPKFCALAPQIWSVNKVPHSPRAFKSDARTSLHPSGELLAGASESTVFIWDLKDHEANTKLAGHLNKVNSVSFSHQGDRLISVGNDKTARIWSVKNEAELFRLSGHEHEVLTGSFSSDGTCVITADSMGDAKVWNAHTGKFLFSLPGHQGAIFTASFSPDGLHIVTGGADRICRVWDSKSRKELLRFTQHRSSITSASFDASGDSIVSAAFDGTAFAWNARNGKVKFTMGDDKAKIISAAYSGDGAYILAGAADGSATIRDSNSGELIQAMRGHNGAVYASSSENASIVATTDKTGAGLLWDAKSTADEVIVHGFGRISNPYVRLSSDGQRLVVDVFREKLSVINTTTGKFMSSIPWVQGMGNDHYDHPISPDGRRFAKLEQQNNGLYDLVIRDVDSGKVFTSLKGYGTRPIFRVSNRGTRIITLNQFGVWFWNGDTGKMIWEKERKSIEGDLLSNSLSPDGTRLATRVGDFISLWDSENGTLLHNFFQSSSSEVAFSGDSSVLVTTHVNFIHVWDVLSGVELQKIKTRENTLHTIGISEDKSLLVASSNRSVFVHDRKTGEELAFFEASDIPVAVGFTSSGIVIADRILDGNGELGIRILRVPVSPSVSQ